MKKSKFCVFFCITLLIFSLITSQLCTTVYAAEVISGDTLAKYQEIIKEVAYSYLRQGNQIHYDQTSKPPKRNIIISPEDATAQRRIYLDCSSFVNNVYYEAFGIHLLRSGANTWSIKTANMLNAARDYPTRRENVGYWTQDSYSSLTEEEKQSFLSGILDNMQAGDVLVYEKAAGGGHTLVYVGDEKFVHCTGTTGTASPNPPSNYYDKAGVTEYTQGAVLETEAYNMFENPESNRYLANMARFCIIRPFARTDISIVPTEKTLNRLTIKGLTMEKTASVHPDKSVDTNDEITYTITLNNTSTVPLAGVEITDSLPDGTAFVSGDPVNNSGSLYWSGDIEAGKSVSISYTVKVTSEVAGKLIQNNKTEVNGVIINPVTHTVAGYSETQREAVANKAKEFAQNSSVFRDGASLIMSAYKDSIGADVFGFIDNGTDISTYSTADEILTQVIDSENYTCHTSTFMSGMLVPHLYGGIDITYSSKAPLDGQRRSDVSVNQLEAGDIILAEYSGGEVAYIYAGNSEVVFLNNGVATVAKINEEYVTATTSSGSTYYRSPSSNKLASLIAYDRFAVLRPSMKPDTSEVNVTGIEITTPPAKLVYNSGDKIDTTGMVVTATMSDGSKRNVTNFALSKSTLSYPETSVDIFFGPYSATLSGLTANLSAFKITELDTAPLNTDIQVEGIYVGIGTTSNATTAATYRPLVLLKDENTNDTIALSLETTMYTVSGSGVNMVLNPNGVTKGDKLRLTVRIQTGDPNYTGNNGRRYLTLADNSITSFADFVASSGNSTSYDLSKAIVISTWEDMQKYYTADNTLPFYSLVVFTGSQYMCGNSSKYAYFIHKNENYSAASDAKPYGSKSVAFRRYAVSTNVQKNWVANGLFGITSIGTSGKGNLVSKDIYALYVGNSTSYFHHTILDSSWVKENRCYIASVSEDNSAVNLVITSPGKYNLYFADYENEMLESCLYAPVTATVSGKVSVDIPEDFVIGEGDKIFLWEADTNSLRPLAPAYVFE